MKLQVAIDLLSVEDTLRLLRRAWEYVDIVEAGPLIKPEGLSAVRLIKAAYPTNWCSQI